MIIRQAVLADLVPLMQTIREVVAAMQACGNTQWDDTYPNTEVFTQDIAQNYLWIADVDGAIGGVLAITDQKEPEYAQIPEWNTPEPAIVLHRLAVNPNYQGMGIAAALLQQAEAEAAKHQIQRIFLDTNSVNRAMQNLSMKLGYHLAGEITLAFRPGLRFMCYEKRLAGLV
ncbi:GNAT family N-acetyltransferase [Mucilaginibacter robiniae]|uniref:GNAT family N-acetyltransferase n=1 Tax=Mucilaginibacter robiniae TaxID=2728022 RepID=A0A7L5DY73_9SPHI|nr:GNAT family N-acetyltransferase [Mucilaginibacter robiniae]QJD95148.1 GNAT family N-acetyltransferase [Mucilaginibacter robiniae]